MLEEERKEAPKKKEDKSEVWRVKQKDDDRQGPGSSAAPVNMVFMLPSEFMAPDSDDEKQSFEKLEDEKRKHLKALFLKGFVDCKPVTKMLVDGYEVVNIMLYAMLRKLEKVMRI